MQVIAQATSNSAAPAARPRIVPLADEWLWIIVSIVVLFEALSTGINFETKYLSNPGSFGADIASSQEASRIYNWISIGACIACLFAAATEAGWRGRALRVFKSPVKWAIAYQTIIAIHYVYEGNTWDLARLCGVWLLLAVAMAASRPVTVDNYAQKMLLLFRSLLWISLGIGIILPNNGWHQDYLMSFLPGVHERFAGVGGSANGMGSIAGIAVLLELGQHLDDNRRWYNTLHLGLGGSLLLLTQSKTALVACAVSSIYLWFRGGSVRTVSRAAKMLTLACVALIGCLFIWLALGEWIALNRQSLVELTGRIGLWKYYWEIGLEKWLFGYGRSLWDSLRVSEAFKYQWGIGNAHNQLLQSFLMTGVLGVGCLLAYVGGLFRCARQMSTSCRIVFTACLLFVVIDSSAEANFEPGSLSGIPVVLMGFCFCRPSAGWIALASDVQRAPRAEDTGPAVLPSSSNDCSDPLLSD
jgi:hypothetical protein